MCPEPVERRVYRIVAELFTVPIETIAPESSPHTIGGWDSVGHLNLVLALEEEFSIAFSPEQIEGMTDVHKITALVAEMDHRNSHR
jgi:acyl carrier protein